MIQKVDCQYDFDILAKLLNGAFATVAKEFGLTIENCPTNNAFITSEELKSQLTKDREFYVFEENFQLLGFVAIEKSSNTSGTFYIEKLAVVPSYRHLGIGRRLMEFASKRVQELGGKRISIGLIDANAQLKKWYAKQGYAEFEVKAIDHLPFDVCMMEKKCL